MFAPLDLDATSLQRLQEALADLQHGDVASAASAARRLIKQSPLMEPAHLLLARAQRAQGLNKQAVQTCKSALLALPRSTALWTELALAQRASARLSESERSYRHVLAIDPANAMALHNLGNLLQARQAWSEAEDCYRQALQLQPEWPVAHFELGNVHWAREMPLLAVASWRAAVARQPSLAQAWFRIAQAEQDAAPDKALEALQAGLSHAPDDVDAVLLLAQLLNRAGRAQEGEACARHAIALAPSRADAHHTLGLSLRVQGQLDASMAPLLRAQHLCTDGSVRAEASYLMALNQIDQGRFTDGLARAQSLLTLPLTAQQQGMAHHLVASALFDAGEAEAAQAHYAQAVQLSPQHTAHRSARVATGLYTDMDAGQHNRALAHALLGTLNVPATALQVQRWDGQRPLRVGWLSGDFRQHSCAHFLWPLLRHLPADRFEHVAYDTGTTTDAWTARFQSVMPHWRQVASLAPRALAELIAQDRIDVLVDLAGLTTGGRIETLAARPAPLILHWLGYLGTLGSEGLGERISDPWVESAATTGAFCERTHALPRPYLAFHAPEDAPPVGPLPMLQRGWPTFGSFNALSKLSEACVAQWAAVLRSIPNARLLLKTKVLADDAVQAMVRKRFAQQGVSSDRLTLVGWAPHIRHHLELYADVDVALDTFPFNGVTTTCEALWMGVPVVSRVGASVCSRQGRTLLQSVGLPDLACHSEADVVRRCQSLVADPGQLSRLRSGLRSRMANSLLCDGADLAAHFTALLEARLRA